MVLSLSVLEAMGIPFFSYLQEILLIFSVFFFGIDVAPSSCVLALPLGANVPGTVVLGADVSPQQNVIQQNLSKHTLNQ